MRLHKCRLPTQFVLQFKKIVVSYIYKTVIFVGLSVCLTDLPLVVIEELGRPTGMFLVWF